nr:methyltransferase domain-containing protein [Anaerolineae bacterium]
MKWLETTPADYDRGLRLLTLGCDARVKAHIAETVCEGERVLEIGCGTGTLALMLARRGATVVGVEFSALAARNTMLRPQDLRAVRHFNHFI